MSKEKEYEQALAALQDWDAYLLEHSGLPGPRGNLELAHAAAQLGREEQFRAWLRQTPEVAPTGTAFEFLPVCGVLGMGRLLAEGRAELAAELRFWANDPRWRMREGVAMALQWLGPQKAALLLDIVCPWAEGTCYEQRAAAAAICEPALLRELQVQQRTLALLDQITAQILARPQRKTEDFIALRKGLAYCWSVAVAACPSEGKPAFEKWLSSPDPDIRWILRENLKKNRLLRMDEPWVLKCQSQL